MAADFEQVKKTKNKTPVGETGCLCISFFLAIASRHRHSTQASQTCEGLHQLWALPQHLAFFFWGIQFFHSLTCDLRDTMPRQRSSTLIPREAEDFRRSDRHFKHVPPLAYLIYLSPIELYMVGLIKSYSCSDLWRICSSWDLNFLHDKLSVLKVSCFIRLVTEPCDQW